MESAEQSRERAAFAVALLWVFTCLVFLLHPQGAVPLFSFFGTEAKWPAVLVNLLAGAAVMVFPLSSIALSAAFLASALAMLAWHSWLGAYQPLVPLAFLWLLLFRKASQGAARRVLLDSLFLGLAAGALHRANHTYLLGFEFLPGGTLFRDLPARGWFAGHAQTWAWVWLLSGVVPLPFLLKGRAAGYLLAGLGAVLAVALYKVLFFGFFLLVPALFFWDRDFLLEWRTARLPRKIAPLHVYFAGMALFFLWYLFFRYNLNVYCFSVALCSFAVMGARPFYSSADSGYGFSPKRAIWAAVLLAGILLPWAIPQIPPPFGLTQFSAREARFPPQVNSQGWKGFQHCQELTRQYALRWGYAAWQAGENCHLLRYRD